MSYTNLKVSWEPCDPNKIPIDLNSYLIDCNGKSIISSQNDRIVVIDDTGVSLLEVTNGNILADINNIQLSVKAGRDIYGDDIMDIYGDISRPYSIEVLVRKQPHEGVINTSDGRTLLTKSIFYADPRVEPNAMKIAKMDKLDSETIVQIYIMCDRYNKPKMVRFITV